MTTDIGLERAKRATKNTEVSVPDLLKLALSDLEDGKERAQACVIIMLDRQDDGIDRNFSYRCGLSTLEEIGLKARALLDDTLNQAV